MRKLLKETAIPRLPNMKTKAKRQTREFPIHKQWSGPPIHPISSIALEDLVALTILCFCENARKKLGCPAGLDAAVWFERLCQDNYSEAHEIGGKIADIMKKEAIKNRKKEKKCGCRSQK